MQLPSSCALLLAVIPFSVSGGFIHPEVHRQWSTPAVLQVPESAFFDATHQCIYVSNIAGNGQSELNLKDGNGFISKLAPCGEIISAHWVTGLHSPKGMNLHNGLLYVADVDEVAVIRVADASLLKTIPIPGAKFLNDIAITPDGRVFVSDMQDDAIYELVGDAFTLWLRSEAISRVNGICVYENSLLTGLRTSIVAVDLDTRESSVFIDGTGRIDGIEIHSPGKILFSDWLGKIYLGTKGSAELLIDTQSDKIYSADIHWIADLNLLLVPTLFDNRLMAYSLKSRMNLIGNLTPDSSFEP